MSTSAGALADRILAVADAAARLNDRQRAYLLAIFEVDQQAEADNRETPWSRFGGKPRAVEWRWLEYCDAVPEIGKPATPLYLAIAKASQIDQGTGATFAALADRGLIEVRWVHGRAQGGDKPYVRMTRQGRRLARVWTGSKAYRAPPPGTLREWHWRALARAYEASAPGLPGEHGEYAHIGWNTWLRLREYKWGALISEHVWQAPRDGRLRITAAGRALYEREYERYRALYPDVDAPEPVALHD